MGGNKGLIMIVLMIVVTFSLWGFVWVNVGGITFGWVITMIALLILVAFSIVFFLGRILEKHGYTKRDIKRLHVILEEHWNEPWEPGYLLYEVQRCIIYHLLLWGFLGTLLLQFKDFSLVLITCVGIVLLLIGGYPLFATMIVWILALPFYFLRDKRAEDAFEFIGKTSLVSTIAIPPIWVVSRYLATQNHPEEILGIFNAVVANAEKFLVLSVLNTLFGFLGLYLSRRVGRRILTIVLLSLAVAMLFVVWSLFKR
ncbi:hypothetical protein E3E38_04685 [Thermococcus sp. 18S1]|uniref:hypothetical protein n=1 Tax=Thermococcus sp. 18S1 TaxID=1638210 RepID=UPI001438911A|nr:hypothetical protein [Thermococcus sp. 18S1]NJE30347.1 hypothetical protein [Thermococcus sp. 18S1]